MRGAGRVGTKLFAGFSNAALARDLAQCRCAGHQHRQQVGHGGAGKEKAAGAFRKAEQLAHPRHHLALDFDGGMIAPAKIGVQSARQHLRQHADSGAAALDPAHEAGMHIAAGIGQHSVHEFAVHVPQRLRSARHRAAEMPAHGVRHRCPDRPFPDVGDIVQHVVQHCVRLGARLRPVLRIQRSIRLRERVFCHAAFARRPARRNSIACTAWKIFFIWAGL